MYILTVATAIAAISTLISAAPSTNLEPETRDLANKLSRRELTCGIPGDMVCGWDMINRGHNIEQMHDWLCEDLGKCDRTNGDAWNSLWHCTDKNWPVARIVCGGEGSCVVDKFNWQFTCKGGSC